MEQSPSFYAATIQRRAAHYGREYAPNTTWDIPGREELIARFKHFVPDLFAYGPLPFAIEQRLLHDYYLDMGSSATAFVFEHQDTLYIARAPGGTNADEHRPHIDSYVLPMLITRGQDGFEQIAACSYEDEICISKYVDGDTLEVATWQDLQRVTTSHLYNVLGAIQFATDNGLVIDDIEGNWIFSPRDGFVIIDVQHHLDSYRSSHTDAFFPMLLRTAELEEAPTVFTLPELAVLCRLARQTETACEAFYRTDCPQKESILALANRTLDLCDILMYRMRGKACLAVT